MDIWDFLSNDQAKWAPRRSRPRVRWSLPSGKNPFKSHRFWAPRRPGVAPLRDPVPKKLHFFWKGFRTRACKDIICVLAQEWPFFCNAKKCAQQIPMYGYHIEARSGEAPRRVFCNFFRRGFGTRACKDIICILAQKRLFATSKQCALVWAHKRANMRHGRRPHA